MRMLLVVPLVLAAVHAGAATQAQKCEKTVVTQVLSCVNNVGGRMRKCYLKTGAGCAAADAGIAKAVAGLEKKILKACPDAATVQAVGYGAAVTPAGLAARAVEICKGDPASVAARTFGGPQAAVLAAADADETKCLDNASKEALKLIKKTAGLYAGCIAKAHKGKVCNVAKTLDEVDTAAGKTTDKVSAKCADLKALIGLNAQVYAARAAEQARCLTAAAHGDPGPLSLDCGPRPAVTVPARGTWVNVTLDEATWGSRCGDGSSYAFWMRLAPEGNPAEKVAVDLQGGGVCIFEQDCQGVQNGSPGLFRADDDGQPGGGYMSDDPGNNPFANWTRVFLPYCTQDVHIGGGRQSIFPAQTVNRYGAINVRAALRYVRDVLWQELAATEAEGYRPDRLTVMFAGESAGAFGVQYNYHYLLDDLRWVHTTAVPDAGLALDNGEPVGVATLGAVIQLEANPIGWGTLPYQPPYCIAGNCGVGPVLQIATSARLKAVPEQQILNVSSQYDDTQVDTTFFDTAVAWINECRESFCENRDLNGVRYWMPAETAPYHTILRTPSRFNTTTAGGVTVAQWLADAMANPDAVVSQVDEGTLVADYPGVHAVTCLGSPSGAFLDVEP